jgi:hypothetical protein
MHLNSAQLAILAEPPLQIIYGLHQVPDLQAEAEKPYSYMQRPWKHVT